MWAILRESPPSERLGLSLVGAAVLGPPSFLLGNLLLNNTLGPWPAHDPRTIAPLVAGLVGAVMGYAAAWVLLWLSRTVALLGFAAYIVALFVLFPDAIDHHESWVDTPDRPQECRGWEFSHYPPGVFDEASTDYCIGLESPLPEG